MILVQLIGSPMKFKGKEAHTFLAKVLLFVDAVLAAPADFAGV